MKIFSSRYITTILVALLLTLIMGIGNASEREHERDRVYNLSLPTNYTNTTEKVTTGLALSMGTAAIDCSTTTRKWQIGGGIGFYGSQSAPVIGACKKYSDAMFKATVGRENGITGGNIGVTFLIE